MKARDVVLLSGSVAMLGLSPSLAHAGGIIRDTGITTANHAMVAMGTLPGNFSNTSSAADYIGLNNPVKTVGSAPNSLAANSTSGDWGFYPDIAANITNTSQLPGGTFGTSWLKSYRFFITANTQGNSASARNTFGNLGATFTAETAANYSGNTAGPFVWTGYQNTQGFASSFKLNLRETVSVFDNPLSGSALQITTITITRAASGVAGDALPLFANLGLLADVNANAQTSGTAETNASGSGEIRIRSSVGGGIFADVFGIGATSFQVGDVSASTSNAAAHLLSTTNLAGSGAALGGSLSPTGIGTDHAVALLWNGLTLTNVGDSVTITTGVQLVPTPGAAALLGIGGLAAFRRRRA